MKYYPFCNSTRNWLCFSVTILPLLHLAQSKKKVFVKSQKILKLWKPIVKRGKNGTNLTNLSIIRYLLWPSLPHFLVLIHWSLAFKNNRRFQSMAISFAKNCKDRCPVFSPCFGVIPGHTWGKNGTRPVITPTYWNFSGAKAGHWKTL